MPLPTTVGWPIIVVELMFMVFGRGTYFVMKTVAMLLKRLIGITFPGN